MSNIRFNPHHDPLWKIKDGTRTVWGADPQGAAALFYANDAKNPTALIFPSEGEEETVLFKLEEDPANPGDFLASFPEATTR